MLFVISFFSVFCLTPLKASLPAAEKTDISAQFAENYVQLPTNADTFQPVPFFKSLQSRFPSGYSTLDNLKKNQIHEELADQKIYRWNKQDFQLDELRPVFPVHLSEFVYINNNKWKVKTAGVNKIEVQNPNSQNTIWYRFDELKNDPYDLGYSFTLKDSFLKSKPDNNASILTTIPQGTLLKALFFEKSFVKVKFKNYEGFINLAETLSKFDFATMIYTRKKWHIVKKRIFDQILTTDQLLISLNHIEGILTPERQGLIASANQKIPIWSAVELTKKKSPQWIQSQIKGHGLVWWPAQFNSQLINSESANMIHIDELIRKPISSVSFQNKNPNKGIVSADGVYITSDGTHWKKIEQFKNYNGPVHYFNDSLIFVGHYRSIDGGKSFENYIQIDKVAQAIESQFGFIPKKLQIKQIETKAPYKIKIQVETGQKKLSLESPLFTQKWKASKIN